ncbi:tautomerase family protein [Oscillibacter sp.]|uniref:tautomerase family protein n=1 Tax=Oscillibacter sp. TaxID=1945593 RepID=UPI002D8092E5|nr:tautomerase family protein [Oscillibacter sp.]
MPFINLYMRRGLTDNQARELVQTVTAAVADNLENTLPRMVRISIYEIPESHLYAGNASPDLAAPTLVLQLGPGRSDEAVGRCLEAVTDAVHRTLSVPREEVRFYVERVPGENFAIGGKLKNFQERVK